jgi:hypothetical protein
MNLTKNEQAIMDFLKQQPRLFYPPTWIAVKMFPNTNRHSAWSSPICLRLVEKGLLERNDNGHYKLN